MSWISDDLAVLERQNLKRSLRVIDQLEQARLHTGGKPLINFSSNNYLGMARHPQVLDAVREVLEHWGAGATSSRLISGTTVIHQDLESALAAFVKKEAALVFPTGYMTNLGVITALAGEGDAVIVDRLCHASIIDAVRLSGARLLVYRHADPNDAKRVLKRAASFRRRLLVSDSLFSMDGDFAPLAELAELCRAHDVMSILDEAHALGVWGEDGRGARFEPANGRMGESAKTTIAGSPGRRVADSDNDWDVVIGTLSKSLGSQGGFAAGSTELIHTLVNKARSFIFTTGLSPASVAAAAAALSLIQEDPKRRMHVQVLAQHLRKGLKDLGFNTLGSESQIVPILLGEAEQALACAAHLEASGIFAPAIRPPTVHASECRIRFSVIAEHTEKDVDQLLNALHVWKAGERH